MAWVDSNTKLIFPKILNLDKASGGWNAEIDNVVHYKKNGVEYIDEYDMGYMYTSLSLSFKVRTDGRRVGYKVIDEVGRWGIFTSSDWISFDEGLDELVYITFPENPENYPGTQSRLANYIELGAYWENEIGETPTIINYNAEEIARLKKGQTATLSCSGKKMTGDVVVSFKSAGSIVYNGSTTEVEAGKTATLQCAGKKMISDVSVAVENGSTEYTDCITFTGETSDFTLKATNKEWDGTVEYSTDHSTWTTWDGSEISSSGQKLYLRGSGNTKFFTSKGVGFVLSARAACSGNIQTLLQYSNPPATLTDDCYHSMFNQCKNLTTAPELPVTTLAPLCYYYMFAGCTSLTVAPKLPATTLASQCYVGMFAGCTSLTTAPELPATTLADICYMQMFQDCTSLTTAPKLPATTLAYACYRNMFAVCKSLTEAPELPATTLAKQCYLSMFQYCTALKISTTQSSEYPTAWRIPSLGTISSTPSDWNTDMLSNTGGTFKSNPSKNATYYGAWTKN